jgi:hypothetical protein
MRRKQGGRPTRQLHFALSALLGLAVANSACEEAKSPDSVESDESESPMEELQAIPVELSAQVADLTKPIDDVQKVIDQLTSIPKRYGIDAADMIAMAKATVESGKVDVTVSGDVSEDARAEIETALTTLNGAVVALRATPDRVASLVSRIATSSAKVPELAAKISVGATAAAANPFAGEGAKAKAQADVQKVKQVVADVTKVVRDTQAKIVGIPAMATGALAKLMASLKGGDGIVPDSDEVASTEGEGDPDADTGTPASARGAVTPGRKPAVVRISIGASTMQIAHVRRTIDSTLATHGLGAVSAGTLAQTTTAEGLRLPEGASTAQFDEKVRAALGAAVTVRISTGVDDSIRVGVGTGVGAENTKTIPANPDEMASNVSAALGELLERCGFARKGAAAPAVVDDGFDDGPPTAPGEKRGSAPTATGSDQVVLKDGTTIRGRVVKQAPGTFVMIETADGTQRTIPWDRVREVVVAPPAKTR